MVSSHEFSEWMAYFSLEQWGPRGDDMRLARLMAQIANVYRDTEKKKTPYEPDDFLPDLEPDWDEWDREIKRQKKQEKVEQEILRIFGALSH